MSTTTYPKDAIISRMEAGLATFDDQERREIEESNFDVITYLTKTRDFAETILPGRIDELRGAMLDFIEIDQAAAIDDRRRAAARLASAAQAIDNSMPRLTSSRGYAVNRRTEPMIRREYDAKRDALRAKIEFVKSAVSPDGLTITALRELKLIEFVN